MGLFNIYTAWQCRRKLKKVGSGCTFLGSRIEIKGRVEMGDRCSVRGNVVLRTHHAGCIVLEDDVELADHVLIQCNNRLLIGRGSFIGEYVVIRDTHHAMRGTDLHWRLTPHISDPITIAAGCYVGAHSYISPGVTLGEGCVVGPCSVVAKDVPPYEIWAGAPASRIAHRTDQTVFTALRRYVDLASMFGVPAETADAPRNPPHEDAR